PASRLFSAYTPRPARQRRLSIETIEMIGKHKTNVVIVIGSITRIEMAIGDATGIRGSAITTVITATIAATEATTTTVAMVTIVATATTVVTATMAAMVTTVAMVITVVTAAITMAPRMWMIMM